MAHERVIETCETFQTNTTTVMFSDASIVNGGLGQAVNTSSRCNGSTEVVIYGFTVTTVGTNISIQMPTTAASVANGTPVTVTGATFSTTALGTVVFPVPMRLRAVAGADANFCVVQTGAGIVTVYYKELS